MMLRKDTPPDTRPRLKQSSTPEGKPFWLLEERVVK
jgi:hypothetical protein